MTRHCEICTSAGGQPLPEPLHKDLVEILSEMAFWARKASEGYCPQEAQERTLQWLYYALSHLAEGVQAPWPRDPWSTEPKPRPLEETKHTCEFPDGPKCVHCGKDAQ